MVTRIAFLTGNNAGNMVMSMDIYPIGSITQSR